MLNTLSPPQVKVEECKRIHTAGNQRFTSPQSNYKEKRSKRLSAFQQKFNTKRFWPIKSALNSKHNFKNRQQSEEFTRRSCSKSKRRMRSPGIEPGAHRSSLFQIPGRNGRLMATMDFTTKPQTLVTNYFLMQEK
ncbi:hypothetical protein EAE99_008040 [Botrytis elliptica]|nr:hypothetical protein EAE99_008040 [Botrytis elliptica]